MAKIKLYDPKTGRKSKDAVDVTDSELAEFLATVASQDKLAIDMGTGDILTRADVPFTAAGAAWEGAKSGMTAGLLGSDREIQQAAERQAPEAYAGGKMVGEIGRDIAAQLGLVALRAPRAAVTGAPIVLSGIQGAAEAGDTEAERVVGGITGAAGAAAGEIIGRGAGAAIKAPLRAAGSALVDFVGRRLGIAAPAAPQAAESAVSRFAAAVDQWRTATKNKKTLQAGEAALEEADRILAAELAARANPPPDPVGFANTINAAKARVIQRLREAGLPDDVARNAFAVEALDPADMPGKQLADRAGPIALEQLNARKNLMPAGLAAGKELLPTALSRAGVRGVAEYAGRPPTRQTTAGARYGTPDWTQQLRAAGLTPEAIADIEANIARLPGERIPPAGEREGDGPSVSPIMRLQRPPVADDATLRAAGSAARQLASGQLQLLGQYYTRTQDPAVIPDMQRLGEWVGGVRQ